MKIFLQRGLFVSIMYVWTFPLLAQFNIKVGYNAAFVKVPTINNMIDQYNEGLEETFDALDPFRSLHGLEIGVRYKMGKAAFEASWTSVSNSSDVFAVENGANFSKKYWLSLTEYSVNAESHFSYFGFGAGIGYRTSRMKTDILGARRKKQELDRSSGFNGKLYLIFQIPGEKVALAVKPYIQIPLSDLDFPAFANKLNLDPIPQTKERFQVFGISIVLYNGKQ
ncbi:MAG: hypothetical protein WAT79_01325 [Saprospiraceae bacterium]